MFSSMTLILAVEAVVAKEIVPVCPRGFPAVAAVPSVMVPTEVHAEPFQ